jgi:hypothetical protein
MHACNGEIYSFAGGIDESNGTGLRSFDNTWDDAERGEQRVQE